MSGAKKENYAFISYKHARGTFFSNDEKWAKILKRQLESWHIPVEIPLDSSTRLNNNNRIEPVIRDVEDFVGGRNLSEETLRYISLSKYLILILSKDMLKDQIQNIRNGSRAYVFDEIEYFISLGNSPQCIIKLYIDDDNDNPINLINPNVYCLPSDIKALNLLFNSNDEQLIIKVKDFNDYGRYQNKRVVAAVASKIFEKDQKIFWNAYKQWRKRLLHRILIIVAFISLTVGAFLYNLIAERNIIEAYGIIGQSENAYNAMDIQGAQILALKAYRTKRNLPIAQYQLYKTASQNPQKPYALLPYRCIFSEDGQEFMHYVNWDKLYIRKTEDLSIIDSIYDERVMTWDIVFSGDRNRIAFLKRFQLKIYDRNEHKFIYDKDVDIPFFTSLNKIFLNHSGEEFISNHIYSENQDASIVNINIGTGICDTLFLGRHCDISKINDNIYNIKISKDSLTTIYEYDSKSRKPTMISQFPTREFFDYNCSISDYIFAYIEDSIFKIEMNGRCVQSTNLTPEQLSNVLDLKCHNNGKAISIRLRGGGVVLYSWMGNYWKKTSFSRFDNSFYVGENNELFGVEGDVFEIQSSSSLQKYINPIEDRFSSVDILDFNKIYVLRNRNASPSLRHEEGLTAFYRQSNQNRLYTNYDQYLIKGVDSVFCYNKDNYLVWDMAIPSFSLYKDIVFSPKRKTFTLQSPETFPHDKQCFYIYSIKDGTTLFNKHNANFEMFLTDDIIVYSTKDRSYIYNIKANVILGSGDFNQWPHNKDASITYLISINKTNCVYLDGKTIYSVNLSTGDIEFQYNIALDYNYYKIKSSHNGSFITITGWDNKQSEHILINIKQNKISKFGYNSIINEVIVSEDDRYAIVAGFESIVVYDLRHMKIKKQIPSHRIIQRDCLCEIFYNNIYIPFMGGDGGYILDLSRMKITTSHYNGGAALFGDYVRIGDCVYHRKSKNILYVTDGTPAFIWDSKIVINNKFYVHDSFETIDTLRNTNQLEDYVSNLVGDRKILEWENL